MASTRINRYELGIHKPDLLTVRKLAEVLKVPVAFLYADTDDEIAELLFKYANASPQVRQQALELLTCLSAVRRSAQDQCTRIARYMKYPV